MSKSSKPTNKSKSGISGTSTTKVTETKSDASKQSSGTDSSLFRATAAYIDAKKEAKSTKSTEDRDPFIEAYIDTRLNGGSPEEASEAGRKAAGLRPAAAGSDSFNLADFRKQYWSEPTPGSIKSLTEEEKQQAIANSQAKHNSTSQSGYEAYRQRYLDSQQAEQTPMFSEQQETASPYESPPPSPAEVYAQRVQETQAQTQPRNKTGAGSLIGKAAGYLLGLSDDINILQGGKTTTQWGSTAPSGASAGADGSKPGLADQSSTSAMKQEQAKKNPLTGVTKVTAATPQETGRPEQSQITQYFWPEDENAMIRYQSNAPFEEYQRILIDEMNAAYDAQDFERGNELRNIYNDKEDSYSAFLRDRYQQTLPKGESAYKSLQDAISAGDVRAYNEAQNTLASNGYSRKDIEEQASEMIHNSNKSSDEKEKELKKYLGLSDSDAQATTLMWWWTDNKGKEAADADKNGRLKQDELGAYLKDLEESSTLTEAQAADIWKETYPTAKTDYSKWKGKGSKPDNPVLTAADADGNGRLKQDELGAFLKQQEAGGMSEEEAADIWKEQFPTAKTDYAKWKGKQKK